MMRTSKNSPITYDELKTYLPTKQSASTVDTVFKETRGNGGEKVYQHFVYLLHVQENDETIRTSVMVIL